jgi:hypothetical protein
VHREFWWGDVRERDHLEDLDMDGNIILKLILKKWDGGMDFFGMVGTRGGRL